MTGLRRRRATIAALIWALTLLPFGASDAIGQAGAPGGPPASTTTSTPSGSDGFRSSGDGVRPTTTGQLRGDVAVFRGRPEFALYGPEGAVADAEQLLVANGAQLLRIRSLPGLNREIRIYDFRGRISLVDARTALAEAGSPAVLDLNSIYRFTQSASQGATPRLYAAGLLGDAERACRVGGATVIGMVDGPVATGHPTLSRANVTRLSSLLPSDRPVGADHGTAVAGLLVGDDPNNVLRGFAPGARLIAVSAFARERGGAGADVDRISGALDALTQARADVINLSFAGPPNAVFDALLADTAGRGSILVGAAGNTNSDATLYPAAARDVIAVTAVDAALRRYRSANFGASVEFAAPGVDIYVANGTAGGRYASGTSYATPIVAALAARLTARGVRSTAAVRNFLRSTSRDLGAPGRDAETGWGLVSAPGC